MGKENSAGQQYMPDEFRTQEDVEAAGGPSQKKADELKGAEKQPTKRIPRWLTGTIGVVAGVATLMGARRADASNADVQNQMMKDRRSAATVVSDVNKNPDGPIFQVPDQTSPTDPTPPKPTPTQEPGLTAVAAKPENAPLSAEVLSYVNTNTPDNIKNAEGINPPDANHSGYWKTGPDGKDQVWYPNLSFNNSNPESQFRETTGEVYIPELDVTIEYDMQPGVTDQAGNTFNSVAFTSNFHDRFMDASKYLTPAELKNIKGTTIKIQKVDFFDQSMISPDFMDVFVKDTDAIGANRVGNTIFVRFFDAVSQQRVVELEQKYTIDHNADPIYDYEIRLGGDITLSLAYAIKGQYATLKNHMIKNSPAEVLDQNKDPQIFKFTAAMSHTSDHYLDPFVEIK